MRPEPRRSAGLRPPRSAASKSRGCLDSRPRRANRPWSGRTGAKRASPRGRCSTRRGLARSLGCHRGRGRCVDTILVVTSDSGLICGDHRRSYKRLPTISVPASTPGDSGDASVRAEEVAPYGVLTPVRPLPPISGPGSYSRLRWASRPDQRRYAGGRRTGASAPATDVLVHGLPGGSRPPDGTLGSRPNPRDADPVVRVV